MLLSVSRAAITFISSLCVVENPNYTLVYLCYLVVRCRTANVRVFSPSLCTVRFVVVVVVIYHCGFHRVIVCVLHRVYIHIYLCVLVGVVSAFIATFFVVVLFAGDRVVLCLPLERPISIVTASLLTCRANRLVPVAQNGGPRSPSAVRLLLLSPLDCTRGTY